MSGAASTATEVMTMGIYDRDPDERPEGPILDEAKLAAAVIRMALLDALSGPYVRPEVAEEARRFLADEDGALSWWCEIAGLDPHVVGQLARRTLEDGRGPGRTVGEPWRLSLR
jgi:hypothetical protein